MGADLDEARPPPLLAGVHGRAEETSPEAPGEGYVISEAAEAVGLPAGVLNVVCADARHRRAARPKDLDRGLVRPSRTVVRQRGTTPRSSPRRRSSVPCCPSSRPTTRRDAVRIANDTIYGLHGAVFTNDVDRAREVAGQDSDRRHRAQRLSSRTSTWATVGSSSPASAVRAGLTGCCRSSSRRPMLLDGPDLQVTATFSSETNRAASETKSGSRRNH